jgi:hypothetical protein
MLNEKCSNTVIHFTAKAEGRDGSPGVLAKPSVIPPSRLGIQLSRHVKRKNEFRKK